MTMTRAHLLRTESTIRILRILIRKYFTSFEKMPAEFYFEIWYFNFD